LYDPYFHINVTPFYQTLLTRWEGEISGADYNSRDTAKERTEKLTLLQNALRNAQRSTLSAQFAKTEADRAAYNLFLQSLSDKIASFEVANIPVAGLRSGVESLLEKSREQTPVTLVPTPSLTEGSALLLPLTPAAPPAFGAEPFIPPVGPSMGAPSFVEPFMPPGLPLPLSPVEAETQPFPMVEPSMGAPTFGVEPFIPPDLPLPLSPVEAATQPFPMVEPGMGAPSFGAEPFVPSDIPLPLSPVEGENQPFPAIFGAEEEMREFPATSFTEFTAAGRTPFTPPVLQPITYPAVTPLPANLTTAELRDLLNEAATLAKEKELEAAQKLVDLVNYILRFNQNVWVDVNYAALKAQANSVQEMIKYRSKPSIK
jgi:hypothetical protein